MLTTTIASAQQWDAPNAWPPLVLVMIEGLEKYASSSSSHPSNVIAIEKEVEQKTLATSTALTLRKDWLSANYKAYESTGYMNEKYNSFNGEGGGGGEYEPQVGFGWTNGVALVLLSDDK